MEQGESSQQSSDGDSSFSVPRGGPIFMQDFLSPLTRAPVFESNVFHELESLKAELGTEPIDFEEDISVDELKIYSDEELVAKAMKIAFEDDKEAKTPSDLAGDPCSSGAEDYQRMLDADTSASYDSTTDLSSGTSYSGDKENANLKKRKRNAKKKGKSKNRTGISRDGEKDKDDDDSYLAKVEHLAKIRQRQEEDKASANLHSLNHEKDNPAALSSGNIETLKYLESYSCPVKTWEEVDITETFTDHLQMKYTLPIVHMYPVCPEFRYCYWLDHSRMKYSLTGRTGPIRYPEVILCIEVYHNKYSWKKTQEFLVLGSQILTELRDKIHCLTDMVMRRANAYDPSGYFLIEEVFCNDTRDHSAIDYSEPILNWLKNHKEEALAKWNSILSGVGKGRKVPLDSKPVSYLPNFRSVAMQRTCFSDLGFRIGSGYLYCHQGDCKHVIVIRDMRLIHPDDVQTRAAYPLLVYQTKTFLKKCSICRIYKATKVTLDDKLAGENPCYFCDNCYYLLHYSEEGTLLYDSFTVHDYLQDYY